MIARANLILAVRDYEDTHQGWPKVINAIDALEAEAEARGAAEVRAQVEAVLEPLYLEVDRINGMTFVGVGDHQYLENDFLPNLLDALSRDPEEESHE